MCGEVFGTWLGVVFFFWGGGGYELEKVFRGQHNYKKPIKNIPEPIKTHQRYTQLVCLSVLYC